MAGKKAARGLGRGLGALLGEDVVGEEKRETVSDEIALLPIRLIDTNINQPRADFGEEALSDLAKSIASVGVIQPIIVRKTGERYEIIAGERRFRASRLAGLDKIPAIVRDWDDERRLAATLIENLQRDDLNPMEEAEGIRRLMDEAGLTQEAVSERLGKSRPAIANTLRLLTLKKSVRDMIRAGKLSAGHGRALAGVESSKQEKLAQLCAAQGWSVRQLERICAAAEKDAPKKEKQARDPQLAKLEEMARERMGVRAKIDGDLNSGKITLTYFTPDDLQRVWEALERIGM